MQAGLLISSGTPWAYSDSSVSETYESTRSSPAVGQLGLQAPEPPLVGAERHRAEVGLVAEHRGA